MTDTDSPAPAEPEIWLVDCPADAPGPAMQVAGIPVAARLARDLARDGHQVFLRCEADCFEDWLLRGQALGVEHLPPDAPVPEGAKILPATSYLGVSLVDEKARKRAEWQLLQTCRRPYDGPADRYLFRAISLRITRALAPLSITPNQVTMVSAFFGLIASFALIRYGEDSTTMLVAGLFVWLAVILDSVDGELARLTYQGSSLGMWLDNLADDIVDTTLLVAFGVAVGGTWMWIAASFAGARAFAAYVIFRSAAKLGHPGDVMAHRWWFESDQETTEVYENPLAPLTLVRSIGRRDVYSLLYGAFLVAAQPLAALCLGALNAGVHFALAVLHLVLYKPKK